MILIRNRIFIMFFIMFSGTFSFFPIQAKEDKSPLSFRAGFEIGRTPLEFHRFPKINPEELRNKDNKNYDAESGGPENFAVPFPVSINPLMHGNTELLDNGFLWRYGIKVPGATDINLGFTKFNLPRGASLHVWADNKERYYQGPYTARDNRPHGELWTPVLPGDRVVVELFYPSSSRMKPVLEIGHVGAGYRDFFGLEGGPFPRQGFCNIDVVCPEGDDWRDQIRSVAVYQLRGRWTCTGTLINDARGSLNPFFLTADHCGISASNASSMVVYWNFESPSCGDLSGGSLSDNQSGATLLASRRDVDMALVELHEMPSEAFDVYYSGWDRSNEQPGGAVGIHHPGTDEKAISFAYSDLGTVSSCIGGNTPDTHWHIPFWDLGTTEPGSSGSGLWNPDNKKLIGFLSGGIASCTITDGYDCYGKFAVAWDGNNSSSRLRDWLDPDGIEPSNVPGTDPLGFQLLPDTHLAAICLPGEAEFEIDILPSGDFNEEVSLSVEGLPSTVTYQFSENPVTPPGTTVLGLDNLERSSFSFRVTGESTEAAKDLRLTVIAADGNPGIVQVTDPYDGAADIATSPNIEWTEASQAVQYEIEIASDEDFENLIYSATSMDNEHAVRTSLAPTTDYFLRIRGVNECGSGTWTVILFTTAMEICLSPGLSIPDNNQAGIVSSTELESDQIIESLRLGINLRHTWVGDLTVDLEHVESGIRKRLFSRPETDISTYGCSGEDLNLVFDDEASLSVQNECSSDGSAYISGESYAPFESLSAFSGLPLGAEWKLIVVDHARADVGTLLEWCLLPLTVGGEHRISVTAEPENGGVVRGGGFYDTGEQADLIARPSPAYCFINWSSGEMEISDHPEYSFNVEGDAEFTAHFDPVFLAVDANPETAPAGDSIDIRVQAVLSSGESCQKEMEICLLAEQGEAYADIDAVELLDQWTGENGRLCGKTDESGFALFRITSTETGEVVLRLSSDALEEEVETSVYFENSEPYSIVFLPVSKEVPSCRRASVDFQLFDFHNNPISGENASSIRVFLSVISSTGAEAVISESGLVSPIWQDVANVGGMMPSEGYASAVLSLMGSGDLELHAQMELPSGNIYESVPELISFTGGILERDLTEISANIKEPLIREEIVKITLVPRDTCGEMLDSGQNIEFLSSKGFLGDTEDKGDGTYSVDFYFDEESCPEEPARIMAVINNIIMQHGIEISANCDQWNLPDGDPDNGLSEIFVSCGCAAGEGGRGGSGMALLLVFSGIFYMFRKFL